MHNSTKKLQNFDYNQIYRKVANYSKENGDRATTVNFQNFLNQKRKVLERPELISYSEKFDLSSPYHPMFCRGDLDRSTGFVNHNNNNGNTSSLSANSNFNSNIQTSRTSLGGKGAFMFQANSNNNVNGGINTQSQ